MYELSDFDNDDPICIAFMIVGVIFIVIIGCFALAVRIGTENGAKIASDAASTQNQQKDTIFDRKDTYTHIIIEQYPGGKTYGVDDEGNVTVLVETN